MPASFDAAAQRLTLDAAEEAGFPGSVRLLEEPQAAFYCWLERHGAAEPLWEGLDPHTAEPRHVLIVDIGGGTSDFSLFELRPGASGAIPDIRRVAVSDHILLGGDNIDLALAVLMEPRLVTERGRMSGPQWDHLVASCRDLKERALSGPGSAQDHYVVALPGRGSSLVAGAQTATLARDEVERLVLDGFFPVCNAGARPYRTQSGLRDWGLPYAADSAITRHLADFLRDRPRVDAVLFNGGSLHAAVLRQRLLDQIAAWQGGARPIELENAEPDLAVARGAARFGKLLHGHAGRIAAGAARAVFLAVQTAPAATNQADPPTLICVLPRNAAAEQVFEINLPGLELRTDQLVSFQACSSTRHGRCRAGDVLPWDADAFHTLPPLQTIIRTAHGADVGPDRTVPVRLAAKMNALGLLQISCVGTDPQTPQSWPLEFNLRPHEQGGAAARGAPARAPVAPNATTEAQQAARDHIATMFTRPPPKSDRLTANAVLKSLERMIGLPRQEWNAALLRNLWPALNEQTMGRKLSVEHEEAWLTLAGFLLRPGFGFAHDELRMDELWRLRDAGLCFPGKRSKVQEYILWRRVAGGLTAERQERLLAGELATYPRRQSVAGTCPPRRLARTPAPRDKGGPDRDIHRPGAAAGRGQAALRAVPCRARPAAEPDAALRGAGDRRGGGVRRARLRGVPGFRLGRARADRSAAISSSGRRASWTTETWMSPSRCATRSPASWRAPVSRPSAPRRSRGSRRSAASTAPPCMASRCPQAWCSAPT